MTDTTKQALTEQLIQLLGTDQVVTGSGPLRLFSSDIYSQGETAALAICPTGRSLLPTALKLISQQGFSIIARGGGLSYTGGYTPERTTSVIVDTRRLDEIVELNEEDMIITVEAGVTWKQIHDVLAPRGLRLPFFGTFSGAKATVGGGVSNGALFLGSAAYGSAADITLGMEVVTARGEVVKTGQSAFTNGAAFFRSYGPDVTGLFLHDAGALGIKTLITLRMIEAPQVVDSVSFTFEDMTSATQALSGVARLGLCEDAYVFDPKTTRHSLEASGLQQNARRLTRVVAGEQGMARGLRQGVKLLQGTHALAKGNLYSLHAVCAGSGRSGVDSALAQVSERAASYGGTEIANAIPSAIRANLFEPVNSVVDTSGERWAALNAKLRHSQVPELLSKTDALFASHKAAMAQTGVSVSRLCMAVSNHVFSFEPVLRWADEWLPAHHRIPETDYLVKIQEPPPNLAARELVATIRSELVALFAQLGLASNQIGKTYPWFEQLNPVTAKLTQELKIALDPDNLMNPGALGL
ncbi:MAG: FAD-binding oxidoreductase [Gammaproteobacteria bacterium]